MVDVSLFIDLLTDHIAKLTLRNKEMLNMKKVLDERGETIEHALQQVKGTNDNIEEKGIELIDFVQLCQLLDIKLEVRSVVMPILETFDKNMYGEVATSEFISCFYKAHIGIFEDEEQENKDEGAPVQAKRYFLNSEEVIREICADINDRNLKDFGTFLKGNDLFHEGKITHHSFF